MFRLVLEDEGPDREGKRGFTLYWSQDFALDPVRQKQNPDGTWPRAQCFRTRLEEFLQAEQRKGNTVLVVERDGRERLVKPESGYSSCACRDCFEVAVSDNVADPDLCWDCEQSGCSEDGDSECRREDAYGDSEQMPV